MAGRGCSISVEVTRSTGDETETLTLPVALHSPLHVLQEQLEELTGISQSRQVVILCDLSDPDRNNDTLLTDRQYQSLFECGIRDGSVLTLHPLGLVRQESKEDTLHRLHRQARETEESYELTTSITAANADHSYNGIMFDVEARGPFEVYVISVSVGGMLGRVRVFARDRPWEDGEIERSSGRWWAHQGSVSTEGWEEVADEFCSPSWDHPREIFLSSPVRVLPGSRIALYIHSGLPDDLGIQYQSYREDVVVAEDEHLMIYPGLGHTGSEPFEEVHGWYRAYRGLAGSLRYSCTRKGWNIWEHALFPRPFRDAVRTMLLIRRRAELAHFAEGTDTMTGSLTVRPSRLMALPLHVLYYTMEFMHWDWFDEVSMRQQPWNSENTDNEGWGTRNPHSPNYTRGAVVARMLTRMFMEQFPEEGGSDDDDRLGPAEWSLEHMIGYLIGGSAMHEADSMGVRILDDSGGVMTVEDSEEDDWDCDDEDETKDDHPSFAPSYAYLHSARQMTHSDDENDDEEDDDDTVEHDDGDLHYQDLDADVGRSNRRPGPDI